MKKIIRGITAILVMGLLVHGNTCFSEEKSRCKKEDQTCREFEKLSREEQFTAIVDKAEKGKNYSGESRYYIGKAYLAVAGAETNTPEQEEAFCRKALEYGATQAYMGLYFLHVQKDEEKALGFLREYIKSRPRDTVPYVLLGENEVKKKNYALADTYLRESRKVSRATSAHVEWLLFQINYILGDYAFSAEMLEAALADGDFKEELKALATDERFKGIGTIPAFKKYQSLIATSGK